jgi:hypothetical protein
MVLRKKSVDEILNKYRRKIEAKVKTDKVERSDYSREYEKFKKEMVPELSRYERLCKSLGNIISLKLSEKDEREYGKLLEASHVDVTPSQALTFSAMSFLGFFILGLMISVGIMFIVGEGIEGFPFLFLFLVIIFSLFIYFFTKNYPKRLANKWRLKASSQMVPAILYIVVYMRHTSNLERAIAFASENLQPPLALDFKKIFYNVQIGKFSTIKESLDSYLEKWRDYSPEFIESFHLVESSLYEPNSGRRIEILEKSLQVVLDGVYDKMLKFTHNVRSPLTNIYMLGVVLPTLALALLPLASTLLQGALVWYHVFIIFNLLVPFFVFFLTDNVLLNRPGGYGESELLELNPLYEKYKSKMPYFWAFLIALPILLIGLSPLIFQFTDFPNWIGVERDFTYEQIGLGFIGAGEDDKFFNFFDSGKGPFGIGALLLSLFIPLGLTLFFSLSYSMKTKELIKSRKKTKQLEREFNSSLFQLGNRLGGGTPAELVFGRIAQSSKGLMTEDFFRRVNYNIRQNGMSVENAIFHKSRGAIIYYPSELISTSMRIMVESVKKGLKIASVSLMSISQYLKNLSKINERLKDLLAEIASDMRSNMTFLAPLLSGVVVGLSGMITLILIKLSNLINSGELADSAFGLGNIIGIFNPEFVIPPYALQISVGIYIMQIIFILTGTLVVINSGEDKLQKTNQIGKNFMRGMILYTIVALVSIIALSFLSTIVLSNIA